MWIEVNEIEARKEAGTLKKCLVGGWVFVPYLVPNTKEVSKGSFFGVRKNLMLFKFEFIEEVARVLDSIKKSFKGLFLKMEEWSPMVGCATNESLSKEIWIRVVGLLVHL